MYKKLFTSESVGAGHPDKICDQIADNILDKVLKEDKNARVAIEVMATNRTIIVGGELKTKGYVDVVSASWEILENLGYSENDFSILSSIHNQSPEISAKVDKKNGTLGAGDQGLMFGYATSETPELMPLPITLANALTRRAEGLRKAKKFPFAKADLKAQVTVDYSNPKPRIHTILMSVQHEAKYNKEHFFGFIKSKIMKKVALEYKLNTDFKTIVNPGGPFVIGGPIGDTGLTGRKIVVDTYGGKGRHGGGAFSGKDYTKVDRSAAYAARWIAKNVVAAQLANECEIQIAYAIGKPKPVSVAVETFGTAKVSTNQIEKAVVKVFDLTLESIVKQLELRNPIYLQTATFGHFGRKDKDFPWEQLNKLQELKKTVKL